MYNENDARVLLTEFGASLDLRHIETDDCSVENHSTMASYFLLTNLRTVTCNKKDGTSNQIILSDCNKWKIFGETIPKGNKSDHELNDSCLHDIVGFHDDEKAAIRNPKISVNIICTENCTRQCKCRQNFLRVAVFGVLSGGTSRLIRRFPQKCCFKVPWDADGKLVKYTIMRNEAKFNRYANALDLCLKLSRDLTKTGTEKRPERWTEWEAIGDKRALENRMCRTNRALIGLGVDDVSEFEKLRVEGLNHIVFAYLQNFPNFKPVSNAKNIFEVAGHCSKEVDDMFRIETTDYGCSCSKFRGFKGAENCLFKIFI